MKPEIMVKWFGAVHSAPLLNVILLFPSESSRLFG